MSSKKFVKFALRENSGLCKGWLSQKFFCVCRFKSLEFLQLGDKKVENEKGLSHIFTLFAL